MKRHHVLMAGVLAVCLVGLGLSVFPRRGDASAAPSAAREKDADATPRIAANRIVHVTVYPDSALVTREIEVPATTGLLELVVSPLPETTVTSTLYTESGEGVRVLTTRFRTRPVKEDTREEVRKIEEEIRTLQQNVRRIQAEMKALQGNLSLLTKLESFTTASTTHATEKGKLDSDAAIALAKYLMEGRTEKSKQVLALEEESQTNAEKMEFAQRKLRNLTSGTSRTERDAVIVVDKTNAGAAKVKLNYLVSSASWRPQYKFRAGTTNKDPVLVEYLAAIVQQTGEDWERVQMTLSTAQPMLNAAPPDLHALAVAVVPRGGAASGVPVTSLQSGLNLPPIASPRSGGAYAQGPGRAGRSNLPMSRLAIANPGQSLQPEVLKKAAKQLREQAQVAANLRSERDASELVNYAAVLDQVCELVVNQDRQKHGGAPIRRNEGPSVTYHLAAKLSVPSRNDDQVIEVARLDMQPEYFYKAIPVLTPHVYRQAQLTNRSRHVLLPGEATMYNGSDFVGRMPLPLVAIGEQFTVGFGAEPQLQIQRQLLDRSKTMQAGNQVLKYEYRILVTSYKSEKVKLQVWDRLPQAEKESMTVTLVKATPELCSDPVYLREERSNNLLRWDVDVEPESRGEKAKKIVYDFQLELDRQSTLGSFQTK